MDYDFAKRYLRLPIQIDESEDSKNASKGIGGSVFLREYIETKVSLRGKLVDLRFYLIKDLPRNLLLSFDTLEAFDGVMYFRQGKCVLNDLGVELRLKNITSKNQPFSTMCTFMPPAMQPSLPTLPSVPNNLLIATSLLPSAASPVNLPTAAPNVFANMVFDNPFSFDDIFSI